MTILASGLTALALFVVVVVAVNRRPLPTPAREVIDVDDLMAIVNAVCWSASLAGQTAADFALWDAEYKERETS